MNMRLLMLILSSIALMDVTSATIPRGIQPGTSATYEMASAFVKNGRYNSIAVYALGTLQADSVSPQGATGHLSDISALALISHLSPAL
jgi:hypothetical protein